MLRERGHHKNSAGDCSVRAASTHLGECDVHRADRHDKWLDGERDADVAEREAQQSERGPRRTRFFERDESDRSREGCRDANAQTVERRARRVVTLRARARRRPGRAGGKVECELPRITRGASISPTHLGSVRP